MEHCSAKRKTGSRRRITPVNGVQWSRGLEVNRPPRASDVGEVWVKLTSKEESW